MSKNKAGKGRGQADDRVRISRATWVELQAQAQAGAAAQSQLGKVVEQVEDLKLTIEDLQDSAAQGRLTVLGQAETIVGGARQKMYGHPKANFDCAAAMAAAYLTKRGTTAIDAHDWAMLNVLAKVAREAHQRTDENLIDMAGYVRTAELVDAAAQQGSANA